MKTWKKPEIETLGVEMTMQGQNIADKFDEIRVDQNGNYWVGGASGPAYNGPIDGELEVID